MLFCGRLGHFRGWGGCCRLPVGRRRSVLPQTPGRGDPDVGRHLSRQDADLSATGSVVADEVELRAVDPQFAAVVVDEAQFAELVHEDPPAFPD